MALIGDLRDIKMQDILRFLKRVGKSGVLRIIGTKKGEVYFKDGKIVCIKVGKDLIELSKALEQCIELLGQIDGEFRLEPTEKDIEGVYELDPDYVVRKMR